MRHLAPRKNGDKWRQAAPIIEHFRKKLSPISAIWRHLKMAPIFVHFKQFLYLAPIGAILIGANLIGTNEH